MNNVKPVILAGGLGSRLRPYTWIVPKPLLPIGERPIIECQLMWLRSYGFREVGVALGYRGDLIRSYLDVAAKKLKMKVFYVQEDKRMGTAKPLTLFKDWIGDSSVLSINGDLLTKFDLNRIINPHPKGVERPQADMVIPARVHEVKLPFGVLKTGELGELTRIDEKPTISSVVLAGIYLLGPAALKLLEDQPNFCDMTELINLLMSVGKSTINYFIFEEPWIAVEHLGDFNEAMNGEWIEWADSLEHRILQLTNTEG